MDTIRRTQLIKQRSVSRGTLSHIENHIEAGDEKVNDIQVRFYELLDIFNKYDFAERELELSDDTYQTADRELFEKRLV